MRTRRLLLFFWTGWVLLYILAAGLPSVLAHTGGTLRLTSARSGNYLLTIWTAPEPPRVDEFHVIVGVAEPMVESLILDAQVTVTLRALEQEGQVVSAPATREQSDNKFLYEAQFVLAEPGLHEVTVTVGAHNDATAGEVSFTVDVLPPAAFNWFPLALLGLAVAITLPLVIFNRRWWWVTLVVILGMAFLVRLGFWQLDRLDQRRARNERVIQQLAQPPLHLTGDPLPGDPAELRDRKVVVRGRFDFSEQVMLVAQNWQGASGVHLITPLQIAGSNQAVLVNRGWIPNREASVENWPHFDEPGTVTVTGFIQLPQTLSQPGTGGAQPAASEPQTSWYRVDVEAIQRQVPYPLLPVYVLQEPPPEGNADLPFRSGPAFDLSDGPHLGYALQWFTFALMLGVGYLYLVWKEEDEARETNHKRR